MSRNLLSCVTLVAFAIGGSATAQTGSMTNGQMAKPMQMSKMQMKTMRACEAMGHDKMMKSRKCMAMMKAHPDMMKDGSMPSDGMMTKR